MLMWMGYWLIFFICFVPATFVRKGTSIHPSIHPPIACHFPQAGHGDRVWDDLLEAFRQAERLGRRRRRRR
jgi:hypothetical protein